jgi:hypothetical protein
VVEFNKGFAIPKPDDRQADLAAQLQLMQTATSEIDSFANIRPDVLGSDDKDNHSGVAINYLQKAGTAELGSFILAYRSWKLRVYRAVWNIIKRNWTQERFIRVGADDTAQLIQINGMGKDKFGNPAFINKIGALNVEIVLDEGPDQATLMQDAYEQLAQMPPGAVPPQVLIYLMPLADDVKKTVMQMMGQKDPQQQQAAQLQMQRIGAEIDEKRAGTFHRYGQAAKAASDAHVNLDTIQRLAAGADQSGVGVDNTGGGQPPQQQPPAQPGIPQRGNVVPLQPRLPPQARMAPDGRHYLPDPTRPGKYNMIVPRRAA